MTKQETLDKNEGSLQKLGNEIFYNKDGVMRALDEYGKYCADQAWKEAIQQCATLSLSNMVNGGFVMKSPNEWWSEFQRKEATECPIKADS